MLLNDLLALFSSQLNIEQVQFTSIVETNNIKLDQSLVLEKKKTVKHETNNIHEKRTRGRPRKQCNIINVPNIISDDVDYEIVEEVSYKDNDYYKTDANILLDTNYNACGLIVDGLVILKDVKDLKKSH